MSKRVAIPLGAVREDIDQRMMPDGQMRRLINARFRRAGGLESCPGWAATGALYQVTYSRDNPVSLAVSDHNGSLRIVGDSALYLQPQASSAPSKLIQCGDLPRVAAPRQWNVVKDSVYPIGVTEYGNYVYTVWREANAHVWFSRFRRDGRRLYSEGDFDSDPGNELTHGNGAISMVDGQRHVYMGTTSGLVRLDLTSNKWITYAATATSYRSLRAVYDATNDVTICVYESTGGQLDWIKASDAPYTTGTLLTDMSTSLTSPRQKWSACCDGNGYLWVAYTTANNWVISVFQVSDMSLLGTYTPSPIIAGDAKMVIGSRLDAGSDGIYWYVYGRDTDSTRLPFAGLRYTTAFTLYPLCYRPLFSESDSTHIDNMVPLSGFATRGGHSYLLLGNSTNPLYDRGYLVSVRHETQGGNHVEPRVEGTFAPGELYTTILNGVWAEPTLDIDDEDGTVRVLAPVTDPAYFDTISYPAGVDLLQWGAADDADDSDGFAVQAKVGGLTLYAGGVVQAYDGESVVDLGFAQGVPEINSLAGVGSGGSFNGTYQFVLVWEWTDATGAKHLSAPTAVSSVTLTDSTSILLTISRRGWPSGMRNVLCHIYRTEADGVTFYELNGTGYSSGIVVTGETQYSINDATSDAELISRPILYTQGETGALGGQLPYAPPPPCRSIAVSPSRVLCGGLPDPNAVHWSHEFYPGEAPSWSDDDSMRARLPDEVVAVAWSGSQWLAFGTDRVWAIGGRGPDVSGAGEWGLPVEIQSPTGCHSPLSIGQTTMGVVFQGNDSKIYVIAPGANVAAPLGPPVWASLYDASQSDDWVVSIVECDRSGVRSIVVQTRSIRLVYDVDHKVWSKETIDMLGRAGLVGETLYWVGERTTDSYYYAYDADPAERPGWAAYQDVTMDLGRIFPFGQDGYGRIRSVILLLSHFESGRFTFEDEDTGDSVAWAGVVGGTFSSSDDGSWNRFAWKLPYQKRESLLAGITGDGAAPIRVHSLALDIDPIAGGRRRASGQGQVSDFDPNPWTDEFEEEFGP